MIYLKSIIQKIQNKREKNSNNMQQISEIDVEKLGEDNLIFKDEGQPIIPDQQLGARAFIHQLISKSTQNKIKNLFAERDKLVEFSLPKLSEATYFQGFLNSDLNKASVKDLVIATITLKHDLDGICKKYQEIQPLVMKYYKFHAKMMEIEEKYDNLCAQYEAQQQSHTEFAFDAKISFLKRFCERFAKIICRKIFSDVEILYSRDVIENIITKMRLAHNLEEIGLKELEKYNFTLKGLIIFFEETKRLSEIKTKTITLLNQETLERSINYFFDFGLDAVQVEKFIETHNGMQSFIDPDY